MKIHKICFLIGWVYYHIIPFLFLHGGYFPEMIPKHGLNTHYFAYACITLIGFFTGTLLAKRVKLTFGRSVYYHKKNNNRLTVILVTSTLILMPILILNMNIGYGHHSNPYLGLVSTLTLIFSFLIVQHIDTYNKLRVNLFFLIFCLLVFYLILSGARLFVVTGVVMIVIGLVKKGILRPHKFLLSGLFFVIALVALGQWRLGIPISLELFSFYFFAETMLLSNSSASYFNEHNIELVNFSWDLFSSVINLIPSVVFPNKSDFYVTLSTQGIVESPFGGMNLLVSLAANFGMIGSFLTIFCFGAIIERAGSVKNISRGSLPIYAFLCAFSLFLLNREAFVTQHKVVIVMGLLFLITISLGKIPYVERRITSTH